jgi:hypothetical protein
MSQAKEIQKAIIVTYECNGKIEDDFIKPNIEFKLKKKFKLINIRLASNWENQLGYPIYSWHYVPYQKTTETL